jgi:hypothetical protein
VQRSTTQVFSLAAQRQFRGLCMLSSSEGSENKNSECQGQSLSTDARVWGQ